MTETSTANLAEWLLEQIAEDERIALQASGSDPGIGPAGGEHWHWVHAEEPNVDQPVDLAADDDPPLRTDLRSVEQYPTMTVGPLPHFVIAYAEEVEHRVAIHVAAWSPARVLAECEAKRRIIERHSPRAAAEGPHEGELICGCSPGVDEWLATAWPCVDVRDIASIFADRPGYRPEWRPE